MTCWRVDVAPWKSRLSELAPISGGRPHTDYPKCTERHISTLHVSAFHTSDAPQSHLSARPVVPYGTTFSGMFFIASRPVVFAKSFGTTNMSAGTAFFSTAMTSSTR